MLYRPTSIVVYCVLYNLERNTWRYSFLHRPGPYEGYSIPGHHSNPRKVMKRTYFLFVDSLTHCNASSGHIWPSLQTQALTLTPSKKKTLPLVKYIMTFANCNNNCDVISSYEATHDRSARRLTNSPTAQHHLLNCGYVYFSVCTRFTSRFSTTTTYYILYVLLKINWNA